MFTREIGETAKSMASEDILLQMKITMKVSLSMETGSVKEDTHGLTEASTKVSGSVTK